MSENPAEYHKKTSQKKWLVITSWVVGALFVLFVAAVFFLSYYAVDILRFTLKETTKTESNGFYSVHFSDLKFNLFKKQFVIKDFELKPDTAFPDSNRQPNKIYNISVETFLLNGVDILSFIKEEKVKISDFVVDNPEIEIISHDTVEGSKQFSKKKLLKLLKLSEDFEVKKFDIINAKINTTSIRFGDTIFQELNAVNIHYFDEDVNRQNESKKVRLLSDNCVVSLGRNSFQSANKRFSIDFEGMSLRGKNREVQLEKALLVFRDSTLKEISKLSLKELSLSEIDFFALLYDKTICLESLKLKQPKLLLHTKKSKTENKKFNFPENYSDLLGDAFDSVSCKNLDVNDFDITLINPEKDSIKIDKIDLKLKNIFLDSASYSSRLQHFFTDSIQIETPKQKFWLKGIDKPLSFESFSFDVINGKLSINNLFADLGSKNGDKKFSASQIDVDINNPFKYLSNRVLQISLLKVSGGDLQFDIEKKQPKQKNKKDIVTALNQAISKFADTLQILNIDFEFKNITSKQGNDLEIIAGPNGLVIQDLQFPIKKWDLLNRPFCSSQMHWQANFLKFRNDKTTIDCKYFSINSRRLGSLTIDEFHLLKTDKQKDTLLNTFVNSIDIEQFDFGNLFYREKIALHTILLQKPQLVLKTSGKTKKDTINIKTIELPYPISVDCFKIENGNLDATIAEENRQKDVSIGRFDLEIDGFATDKIVVDNNVFMGDILGFRFSSQNHALKLSNSEDVFSLDKFQLSSYDSLFRFVNTRIDISQQGVEVELNLPSFSIYGFDAQKMLKEHNFVSREIKMEKGILDVYLPDDWQKSTQNKEKKRDVKSDILARFIQSIKIDRYAIDSLQVRFQVINDGNKNHFYGDYLNFDLKDFYFDADKSEISKNTIIDQDFALTLSDYKFYLQDSVYKAEFKSMEISTFPPAVKLKDLVIEPIVELPDSVIKATVRLEELILSDINWEKLISEKQIDFNKLIIEKPVATIVLPKKSKNHKKEKEPFIKKLGSISHITLDSLLLNNGDFKIREFNNEDYDFSVEYFNVSNLHLDSTHNTFANPLAFVDDYEIKTKKLNFDLGKMMKLHLDAVELSTSKGLLIIDSLCLIPRYSKVKYARVLGYETDWTLMKTSSITAESVDFTKFFEENYLSIQKISIDGMNLTDYRDKRLPMRPDFFPPMPIENLKRIPIPLHIDSLKINSAYIKYEEQGVHAKNAGMIHLDSLNAIIYDITNDSLLLATGTDLVIDANAKLMNDGAFNFHCRLFGDDSLQGFRASGGMSTMDLTLLDTIIEPLGFIDIRSGNAKFMSFHWDGNRKNAIGKMTFLYDDLKIGLIDKKKLKADAGDNILAFLANTFVIRKKNPKWMFPRKGGIYFERDAQKSIFNYWSKSAISGIKSSIGLGKNKPKREEKRAAKKRARRNRKLRKE